MAVLGKLGHYSSSGLLVMRIGLGAMMIYHGYPKLLGGPENWAGLGKSINHLGIHSYYTFWGFMAAFSETVCALFVILGLWFRPATILLTITMIVAAAHHLNDPNTQSPLRDASHAIELAFAFLGLIFVGPGKYSVDKG